MHLYSKAILKGNALTTSPTPYDTQLGVVGLEDLTGYNNYATKVIQAAGAYMDFFSIHPYGYWDLPPNTAAGWAQALDQPRAYYPTMLSSLRSAFTQLAVCTARFTAEFMPLCI